jgi:hypothetical protein
MGRNFKFLLLCLSILSAVGTALWLVRRRNFLPTPPARPAAASTPATIAPSASATPASSSGATTTPPVSSAIDFGDAFTFIAFRYDKSHIAFRLREQGDFDLDQEQAKALRTLPEPALNGGGAPTWEIPPNLLESLKEHFQAAHVGEEWQLELSSDSRASVVIQKAVAFTWNCSEGHTAGFLAEVAPQDQAAFAASPNEYFLVHKSAGTFSSNSNSQQTHLGLLSDWKPSPEVRAQIEQALEAKRKKQFDDERSAGMFRDERALFEKEASAGNVKLSYDIKAMRISPDGFPLLFIRARWSAGDRTEFMPELWLHLGPTPTVESFEETNLPGIWLTWANPLENDRPFTQPGAILNVFDRRGDGYGEVLVLLTGGDGYVIRLYSYTPNGFVSTDIEIGDGC